MNRLRRVALVTLLFLIPQVTMAESGDDALRGLWITASGNLEIKIDGCGDALCGKVNQVLANRSMSNPGEESNAPPPALGADILSEISLRNDVDWKGKIYNRETGKTYRCHLTLLEDNSLEIRAYVGIPLFGSTQIWTRAPSG